VLGHQEDGCQVRGDAPVPLLERQALDGRTRRAAQGRVVDQRIEPSVAGLQRAHAGLDRGFARNVAADEPESAALCLAAVARPMPRAPPVTSAVFTASRAILALDQ
jgi:hypothetical protein